MADLEIRPGLSIPVDEIDFTFSRSGGPGGQNVNKLETRVQLRFALMASKALTEGQKKRIAAHAGRRVTTDGDLILTCQRHRERERNRQELRERLQRLIAEALAPRKRRVKTKPTRASRERRLEGKRRRAQTKRLREKPR